MSLQKNNPKINSLTEVKKKIRIWRDQNQSIVFTNGCFDILHKGHLYLLSKAKEMASRLIVGLNSDDSVKRLKGEKRPINPLNDRLKSLSSVPEVDVIVVFEEDTPLELIKAIQPDVIVKGGDYKKEEIIGADFVESTGGKIIIVDLLKGFSTSNIISRNF